MVVFLVSNYQILLNKPRIPIKSAAESMFRLCMDSGATLYNNTMYAIRTRQKVLAD